MNSSNPLFLSDKQLVESILQGNQKAFAQIVRQTEKLVASIVLKMIKNPEEQKDLAQDIYLRAYKQLGGFQFQSKLSTWIAQIAYNICIDHLRKKKIEILVMEEEADGDIYRKTGILHFNESGETESIIPLLNKERKDILQKAIDQLSPLYKTLITLYHHQNLSYDEIATITRLPSGTVKNYLFRARKNLRDHLSSHYKKEEL